MVYSMISLQKFAFVFIVLIPINSTVSSNKYMSHRFSGLFSVSFCYLPLRLQYVVLLSTTVSNTSSYYSIIIITALFLGSG